MLYRIPLMGNPSINVALQKKYKAAFGDACYVSAANTFDCFYEDPQKACKDAVLVPDVFGAAPYGRYPDTCNEVGTTKDYTLQVGPDPANKIDIKLEAAPLETSLIDVDDVPTEIDGPYRDLPAPNEVAPGNTFHCAKISGVKQWEVILQANRDAHDGGIRSDLAGFEYPCKDECGKWTKCTEPEFLKETGAKHRDAARVHHVVRRTDLRGCKWGSNANGNAAVISRGLNGHLHNKYPLKEEVEQINKVPPYTYTP